MTKESNHHKRHLL